MATMDDPDDVREPSSGPLPGAAEAGMAGAGVQDGKPRWDGGIAKNRMGQLATIPVTVRWESAKIIQQALEREHGNSSLGVSASSNKFEITVIGLLPANQNLFPPGIEANSSSDPSAQKRTAEETLEWFMANSRLLMKGETSEQPVNVKIDKGGAVRVFFNRSQPLLAHKRDVFFVTRFGSMNVQARFRVKDMVVDGHPDL